MIVSLALIVAVAKYNVPPDYLALLIITWIPDIIILGAFAGIMEVFKQ